jgi:uncharacterized protein with ATP-grasp and redox domains
MKSVSLCYPCFLKQAYSSLAYSNVDEQKRVWVLREIAGMLPDLDLEQNPAYNSSLVLLRVAELSGDKDPYAEERRKSNQMALDMLPALRERIEQRNDPLETSVRLSVVGNIIDLGIQHKADMAETIESALGEGFAVFEIDEFKNALDASQRILYILDNAGEIVFDMLLIDQLRRTGKQMIAAVRGGPVLNDALMEDAKQVGLDKLCRIIDTGNNFTGVIREKCSPVMLKALDTADLVIAKGQANYESLEGTRGNMFFILKSKCQATAEHMAVNEGDLVFKRA